MASEDTQAIRPLHSLEQWSSARHHLSLYSCVIITARYEHSGPRDQDKPHPVYNALITLVKRHGALRVGIVDDDTKKPYYCHIPKVNLRNHVDFQRLQCSSSQDYESKLAQLQASRHDRRFQDISKVAPWRLTIVSPEIDDSPGNKAEDFMFAFHHSILDGPSGRLFHEQLVACLNYPSCSLAWTDEQSYELDFAVKVEMPPPREEIIPSNMTKAFVASTVWKALAPSWLQKTPEPWWGGKTIDFDLPYKTRMHSIDVPSDTLASLLKGCRAHSTTLSALLHALILASLARRLDAQTAPSFTSNTPIDYRLLPVDGVAKAYKETLSNCVTASDEKHPALVTSAFRAPDFDLDALVWSNAQRIGKTIADRRASLPVNDPVMLFGLVTDMNDYCRQKNGSQRDTSWELSNIGIVKGVPFESPDHKAWRITRTLFSNSSAVIGPAMSVNVASVPGESLTIAIVWQESVVEEEIISGLASDLVASAERFQNEGKFA